MYTPISSLYSKCRALLIGSTLALSTVAIVTVPTSLMLVSTTGCNQADVQKTVALIDSQIPTAISLTQTAVAVLALTPYGAIASVVQQHVQGDLNLLSGLCKQYLASNDPSVYQSIITLVDSIVVNGDAALLDAAGIKDPIQKATITASIGALDTVLHVIDGYLQAARSTKDVKATAASRTIKVQQISMYWNRDLLIKGAKAADPANAMLLNDPTGYTMVNQWYAQEQSLGF